MAGEMVALAFAPGFVPNPSGFEFTTDPIDVSEFARATLVLRGGIAAAGAGGGVTLTVQESSDRVTWAAPLVPKVRIFSDGAFEEATCLDLNRPWLRAKVAFRCLATEFAALRSAFHAKLRLEKREP